MTCTHSRTDGRYDNNRYVHIVSYSNSSNIRTELYNIHGAEKVAATRKLLISIKFFQFTRQSSIAASWPSVPCPSWSWLWLALPTRRPCLQRNQCSPRLSTKLIRHGTTSCTANVASHAWSKRDLGTSSTLVSRAHARYALTPMRLQTYEEVTSTKHRLTLNRMKQRPVSKRAHKAFGVLCQEEGTPGTAHIFQVPTSSIAPCQEVL